jgi:plastocyanin
MKYRSLPSFARPLLVLVALVAGALAISACGGSSETTGSIDHRFEIPADASERMDRGEKIQLLPETLEVTVGDTMTIVNKDAEAQSLGPYFVGAGETITQRFKSVAVLEGDCAFTGDGTYKIVVNQRASD